MFPPSRTFALVLVPLLGLGSVACAAGGGTPRKNSAGTGSFPGDPGFPGAGSTPGGGGGPSGFGDAATSRHVDCDSVLDVVYRDFNDSHPDFEMAFSGDVVRLKLVAENLGNDNKPVFASGIGCPPDGNKPNTCANWTPTQPVITSKETFDQWYRTTDGVNIEIPKTLELAEDPPGSGEYVYDSSSFFPLGPNEGFGITPPNNNLGMNFLFTTEIHVGFTYEAGQVFTFRGDDDLWIFVNGKIAMDLGSMHNPAEGTIHFDERAAELGISPGNTYPMDIFQAERHTSGSNFRFETNIGCFVPADVQ